ncbi:MAG: hypothetical protein SOR93_19215 [Clostridiales Family XIII bacterium]|uniref:hypothetical protein n=1 Tax=Hominibacterium faecale TaxID=2839743 RepID=UPI0022B2A7D3|nr:hypothetical protein [Hominibacterium faecale]MCI7304506.1 hypothetical protein [Clostridia bacterium]MDY3013374.1 hypothetical protein [Clostridiales Family XIII bacterium]
MRSDQKHKKKKQKEKWEEAYLDTLFLSWFEEPHTETEIYRRMQFDSDLRSFGSRNWMKRMLKAGYLKKEKSVAITSTAKGRTFLSEAVISITEKGKAFVSKRQDFLLFFKFASPYVTISDYQKWKRRTGKSDFETVMISLLMSKLNHHRKQNDYLGVQNLFCEIGELYERISCKPQALYSYLSALYFEASGLDYYEYFLKYIRNQMTREELQGGYEGLYLSPGIRSRLQGVKDKYQEGLIEHIYQKFPVNMHLSTKKQFQKIVLEILENRFSNYRWQAVFQENFDRMISVVDEYKRR